MLDYGRLVQEMVFEDYTTFFMVINGNTAVVTNYAQEKTTIKIAYKNGELHLTDQLISNPNHSEVYFSRTVL